VVLIWILGAIVAGGLLYLTLPLLAATVLLVLRVLFYVILACVGFRVIMFVAFLATNYFQAP
jgi:hypothetical protein